MKQKEVLETSGEEHINIVAIDNLATLYDTHGKPEAATLCLEAVERKTLGEDHPDTTVAIDSLAITLYVQGKLEEGATLGRRRKTLGEDHRGTMRSLTLILCKRNDQSRDHAPH
jgi:hypothetical protein